jgi:hypothetical protein
MPPVTMKMSDPQDAWQHALGKVLLYEEHDNLRPGLTAMGFKDITDVKHGIMICIKEHDFECLHPNFGWKTTDYTKKTLSYAQALQDIFPSRKCHPA